MTLEFTREVVFVRYFPVVGTVFVEADLEDGLLYPICTGFEPETPMPGLPWSEVEAPCKDWLVANAKRIHKRFEERP